MSQPLLILGASARAAACSALRAGFVPLAGDSFGDADLRARCHAVAIDDYPRGLAEFARECPDSPWIYTGALENKPALVDRIARDRTLWGNGAGVLRQVRDPWRVAAALAEAGLPAPRLAAADSVMTSSGRWLYKPLASGGGGRIYPCDSPTAAAANPDPTGTRPTRAGYLQAFIAGETWAAVYVAAGGRARLLGVTRQLTGARWAGAEGFQYAGSVGPLRLNDECERQFQLIGDCLAAKFGLIGLFGVDTIVAHDRVWPVEINPRYTASVEIIERAAAWHTLRWHAAACVDAALPDLPQRAPHPGRSFGKAVIYAAADIVIGKACTRRLAADLTAAWPRFADVPAAGTRVGRGQPVMTVFADGDSQEEVEEQLRRRAAEVRNWLRK